jgi:hypothetical protein
MALDELHARRLATVASVFESALDRMELVLKSREAANGDGSSTITPEQVRLARLRIDRIRTRLKEALEQFSIPLNRPESKQVLAAELSTLWVVLENARPERMKGYGREFEPSDRAAWSQLMENLMMDVEQIRRILIAGEVEDQSLNGGTNRAGSS